MFKSVSSLVVLAAIAFSGCATTHFQSTWRNPAAPPLQLSGRKVAAVFVTRDALLRRRAEDAIAREINARGAQGVASYTFLTEREMRDSDAARAAAHDLGFAGAVVMRVVGIETSYGRTTVAVMWGSSPYDRFWGDYWRWGWGAVWQPAYLTADRTVKVETLVYSLESDQLVWAGVTHTFAPERVESLISELAVAISDRMAEEGLVRRD